MRGIIRYGLILGIMSLMVLVANSSAATGVENITLTGYSANALVLPGGNMTANYNLVKVSGYISSGTTLYIVNNKQLISHNITALLTNIFGNPPLNGTLHVFVAHGTPLGAYNVTISGNSTGVTVNPAVLSFIVGMIQNSTTSATTTATASTTQSTAASTSISWTTVPSTIAAASYQAPSIPSSVSYYIVGALVLVIIILLIMLGRRGGNADKGKAEKKPVGYKT